MPLLIDLLPAEAVQIGEVIVRVERKTGAKVRLSVGAPADMAIQHIRDPQERVASNHRAHECRDAERDTHGKHPVRPGPRAVP